MTNFINFEELSGQFKVYLLILHTIVLGLIVHILVAVFYIRKDEDNDLTTKQSSGVRIVHVDDKRVTVESCQWINSILNWMHTNSSNTPDLVKIWLAMLNEKLKVEKSSLNFKINGIVPGSLPPKFTNVYCSDVDGTIQCIALHIEATKLGFFVSLFDNNNTSVSPSNIEVNVTKLSGQLMFQVLNRESQYDLTVKFIGDPELEVSTKDINEESERSTIEEKLKEVICKTVVNIPLTDGKPSEEIPTMDTSSVPEASSSCVDLEGKLLIKVAKASDLRGIEETDNLDAYCVITCREPRQKKKTMSVKGSKDPFWNESFVLDIDKKTKEVEFDIYNELKTPKEENFHMNEFFEKSSGTGPDFLGQVIVPLTMIAKDQSCRLILPILPISAKSSYVTGQISLEFSYDKDGKSFEGILQSQTSSPKDTLGDEVVQSTVEDEEKSRASPQKLVFSMATIDIVEDEDDQLHLTPLEDHGRNREDIIVAEQRIFEGRIPSAKFGEDDMSVEDNEKHEELLQELKELDRRSATIENLEFDVKPTEDERNESKDRPSSRQSNQRFQATSPSQTSGETPSQEPSRTQQSSVDKVEHGASAMIELDQKLIEGATPEIRREIFREAFNQRINSRSPVTTVDNGERVLQSTPVESNNPAEKHLPNTKSESNLSLSCSLYEGNKSVLVMETKERGVVKYFQIPYLMQKRGTFDHKGVKLHVCMDHLFVATHFTGSLPSCSICKLPLTGYFGKQGYECRDCRMVTHKRCHTETKDVCTASTLPSLKIVILDDKSE